MAKVKITGHQSGSGVLTITAPNTSTDRTVTLPDATATIATTTDVAARLPSITDNGNATAMTIDSNEGVGIKNTNSDSFLYKGLAVGDGGSADQGVNIYSSAWGALTFADATSGVGRYEGSIAYNHAENRMAIATNHATAINIQSTGAVGIGTLASNYNSTADNLVVYDASNHAGMTIANGAANKVGAIYFADGTSGTAEYEGYIEYNHSNNSFNFGTNHASRMLIDSTGAVTMPAQPAFLVNAATMNNIAINTDTTVTFSTERFDQNSDFNPSNYTFTAPVTGKYLLTVQILLAPFPIDANYIDIILRTSNRNTEFLIDPRSYDQSPAYHTLGGSFLVDMDAGDTSYVDFAQSAGSATTDISNVSFFSGYLAC